MISRHMLSSAVNNLVWSYVEFSEGTMNGTPVSIAVQNNNGLSYWHTWCHQSFTHKVEALGTSAEGSVFGELNKYSMGWASRSWWLIRWHYSSKLYDNKNICLLWLKYSLGWQHVYSHWISIMIATSLHLLSMLCSSTTVVSKSYFQHSRPSYTFLTCSMH